MTRVPELRFAGFAGEWEDSIFGDEVVRKSSNSDDNNLVRVEYEDIIPDLGILNKNLNSKNSAKRGILFGENDVLYGKLRPYLKNYLNPYFQGIAVGDFWVLNFLEGDSNFLFYHLQTNRFQSIANTSIGTKMPRADWNLVSDSIFSFPIKVEQEKIGDLFSKIDQLIENQEKLLDQSIAFKKSMVQKMFPKKDSLVPEFRFDGFSGSWQTVKVKDIFKITRGNVLSREKTSEEKTEIFSYPVYSSQTTNNGLMGYYNDYLFDTAITWTTDGANAGDVNFRNGRFYATNVCGVLLSEKEHANKAVAEILNSIAYKHVSKVGNPKLMNNVMSEIIIRIPNNIEEEIKISNFLKKLEEKIAREEKLLDAYKMMKKSLLQKMFV